MVSLFVSTPREVRQREAFCKGTGLLVGLIYVSFIIVDYLARNFCPFLM